MAYNLKRRVRKAQVIAFNGLTSEYRRVMELLKTGAYYDELEDEDKEAYCRYHHAGRQALEMVEIMIGGTLHFKLQPAEKPPANEEEMRERIDEVREIMDSIKEKEYTPEEKANLEARHEALTAYLNAMTY